ncbi:MAG: class II D-tagatose-bisphosphate aldolase, non-catalytic subunit [Clostridiaceae bacterium]|jgi:D-tagatose-1,6-bisphosphate aldolase subunit GatZ/KbaZ|nr:class II D-tagatose-bisphosphate aldolase, non-catalytic subunit [Clostridiaceae bacterium]
MSGLHPMKEIVKKQKMGVPVGIYSACSANDLVLEAVMERAKESDDVVLIEATANQVNQYGGYTGMLPADFRNFVYNLADKVGFSKDKIILGGDHLGPLTWKNEPAQSAMEKSKELIRQFVLAGFTKIHIDTSMHLGDDNANEKLDTKVIAERGAVLAEVAEESYKELKASQPEAIHPVYVVGSEVPIPGGSQDEEEGLQVTRVADFEETVQVFKDAFVKHNLENAWENVIAVVVQPGVEFGDESIHEYSREAAKELCDSLKKYPDLVFEGHSTDYQTKFAFREMVQDGIAILKVGPALTFALREALFSLSYIENELITENTGKKPSGFIEVLEEVMLKNPDNWKKHYHGDEHRLKLARKYSLSDRCRYYLPLPEVQKAINQLFENLKSVKIPLTLISQYMPLQYIKIREGKLNNDPVSLAKDRVVNCIDEYLYGCRQ